MQNNSFNLIDETWIPIVNIGKVSLQQVFTESSYSALGGNPIQKIALMKLLLAIAQAAYTPADEADWKQLGTDGLSEKCLAYLEKWRNKFYLYGEQPFLQMPKVENLIETRTAKETAQATTNGKKLEAEKKGKPKPFGAGFYPDLPSENNTMLSHTLFERELSNAEKTVFIVSLMNFAFGGKHVEKDLTNLSGKVYGFQHTAKSAPSLGNYVGYLHSYLTGKNLLTTLWLNLLTAEQIAANKIWEHGLGIPPWEKMPETENCNTAEQLKKSYMGCLVAMSRFVLLQNGGIYYLEGIQYKSHKEGWYEPSMAINHQEKEIKVLWTDVKKRPWRDLTSLLSFIQATGQGGFDCQQISGGFLRARKVNQNMGIWSGGLKVRLVPGDQSVKEDDDFIESCVLLPSNEDMSDSDWFEKLKLEMTELDYVANKIVYGKTMGYFTSQKVRDSDAKKQAAQAQHLFWQLSERKFQDLVNACATDDEQLKTLRKTFAGFASTAYNTYCPNNTARQLNAWAENLPNFSKYLKNDQPQEAKA